MQGRREQHIHRLVSKAQEAGYQIGHARHDLEEKQYLREEELSNVAEHVSIGSREYAKFQIKDFVKKKIGDVAYHVG